MLFACNNDSDIPISHLNFPLIPTSFQIFLDNIKLDTGDKGADINFSADRTELWVVNQNLTSSVDLSVDKFRNLTVLTFRYNQFISLDISHNLLLMDIYLNHNQPTTLDVSKNVNLSTLNLEYNQFIALNISGDSVLNSVLNYLYLSDNTNNGKLIATNAQKGKNKWWLPSNGWAWKVLNKKKVGFLHLTKLYRSFKSD